MSSFFSVLHSRNKELGSGLTSAGHCSQGTLFRWQAITINKDQITVPGSVSWLCLQSISILLKYSAASWKGIAMIKNQVPWESQPQSDCASPSASLVREVFHSEQPGILPTSSEAGSCLAPPVVPCNWLLLFRCCFLLLLTCKGDSSELCKLICIIISITVVGMSCQKLDIPFSQLLHTYIWMARKHTVLSRLNWKGTSPGESTQGRQLLFCALLIAAGGTLLDTKGSQFYIYLGRTTSPLPCLGGEWEFCRQALGLLWRTKTVCNECKNHLATCCFTYLLKQFWAQVAYS